MKKTRNILISIMYICLIFAGLGNGFLLKAESLNNKFDFDTTFEEKVLPYYIDNATDGKNEKMSEHWEIKNTELIRKNDIDNEDILSQNAVLYFDKLNLKYFEASFSIKSASISNGVAGLVFGNTLVNSRFMSSGNAVFLLPDKKIEIMGSTIVKSIKTDALVTDSDGYVDINIKVSKGNIQVLTGGNAYINIKIDDDLITKGRIGLFSAHTLAVFRNGVTIYALNENGERVKLEESTLVQDVKVNENSKDFIMLLGDEGKQISYTIIPQASTNKAVSYLVESPDVVAIDNDGKMYPLKVGVSYFYIIASDGGFRGQGKVTVKSTSIMVEKVSLDRKNATGKVGETIVLTASYFPDEAINRSFRWSSSNTKVAMVNNGSIILLSEGECEITVKDEKGKFSDTCKITVKNDSDNMGLYIGLTIAGIIVLIGIGTLLFIFLRRKKCLKK